MSASFLQSDAFTFNHFPIELTMNCVSDAVFMHEYKKTSNTMQSDNFFFANNMACEISGYSREELVGMEPWFLFKNMTACAYNEMLEESLKNATANSHFDSAIINKNSKIIKVKVTVCTYTQNHSMISVIIVKKLLEITNNDNWCNSEKSFFSSDRMNSLSVLVSGMAHEINNPNNLIILSADILREIWDEIFQIVDKHFERNENLTIHGMKKDMLKQNVLNLINNIFSGSNRITNTISAIKDFVRADWNERKTECDIISIISSAILACNKLLQETTDNFEFSHDPNIPPIKCFTQLINRAIVNIINNACQALTDRSQKIEVRVKYIPESAEIKIIIADEGRGIVPEYIKLIYDPFFTTNRDKGQPGLGLSLSYSVIKMHDGRIEFDTECGSGTTVTITLPFN